jgi:hypothetical protein
VLARILDLLPGARKNLKVIQLRRIGMLGAAARTEKSFAAKRTS